MKNTTMSVSKFFKEHWIGTSIVTLLLGVSGNAIYDKFPFANVAEFMSGLLGETLPHKSAPRPTSTSVPAVPRASSVAATNAVVQKAPTAPSLPAMPSIEEVTRQGQLAAVSRNSDPTSKPPAERDKEYPAAFKHYLQAAETGTPEAQYILGDLFVQGLAVKHDYKQGFAWHLKAAQQGFPPAELAVALKLDYGVGTARDQAAAAQWYRKAAEAGEPRAQYWLAFYLRTGKNPYIPKDLHEAFAWNLKAAEQGLADAQILVAVEYDQGGILKTNPKEALKWLQKAAREYMASPGRDWARDALRARGSTW